MPVFSLSSLKNSRLHRDSGLFQRLSLPCLCKIRREGPIKSQKSESLKSGIGDYAEIIADLSLSNWS